jgi:replication initiation protein RepC
MPDTSLTPLPSPTPIRAAGARRVTLDMRARLDQADGFLGVPPGTAKPLTFLAAFQEAEPYLGLPAHAFKLVSWLVKQTRPQDWERGSRPIAWPSARRQQEYLGLSPAAVKNLNRALFEAGIFVIRDNEQGKRYGRRGPDGRIVEAFGFDLSPMALRHEEFIRIAAAAKVERERMKELRRRKTLAIRAIRQALEELMAQGHDDETVRLLARETAELAVAARRAERSEDLGLIVKGLERGKAEAEQLLRALIKPVESNPEGLVDEPRQFTTTTLAENPTDTVIARRKSRSAEGTAPKAPASASVAPALGAFPEQGTRGLELTLPSLRLTPMQLVELAPRLARYIEHTLDTLTWPDIVNGAKWLAGELGVSRTLWGHACGVMGRNLAAVALAFVTTRPEGHFTSGPAGYYAGMVKKAEKSDLHLDRTLWKLRENKWGTADRRRAQ